ncbi:MAG: pentapeptide repeat-containing protein, partial [Sedimentisphaerales bacterium]
MSDSEKQKSSWRERRQTIKHKWLVPFIFPEWLCERLSYLLGRWAFLEILGYAGRLTILVAVIFYFFEADERRLQSTSLRMQVENLGLQLENQRKSKHYQAWQVINAAQGKTSSGGRIDALQDLHRDGISLTGVDISKAHLPKLNLENAHLTYANLTEADLRFANLSRANLWGANLTRAFLYDVNLAGAFLYDANLTGAWLPEANLTGAALWNANLTGANLDDANLAGAFLYDANLTNIKNWQKIKRIEEANIFSVKNPPDEFIKWATEHGAVIIEDI